MQVPQNILEELERRRQMAQTNADPTLTSAEPITPVTSPSMPGEVSPPLGGETSISKVPPPQGGETLTPTAGGSWFFDYLTRLAIFAAVFFTPLFFFNASDILGLPKQLLLSSLALTALAGWVCQTIASGHIVWRRSFLTWAALAAAASAVLSSVFSSSFWVSFLGDVGRYDFSGVSVLAYAVMFIVASQSLVKRDVKVVAGLWLASAFLVTAVSGLKFMGLSVLPWNLAKDRLFNSIGGPFSLSLFVLASLPFAAAVWPDAKKRWQKIVLGLIVLSGLALAAVIDFKSGWAALAVSGLVLAAVNFLRAPRTGADRRGLNADYSQTGIDLSSKFQVPSSETGGWSFQRNMALPAALVVIAAALWLVGVPRIGGLDFPVEINPSYRASVEVMAETLKDNLVFGSGLETFPYVYAQFKSATLNQTNFWGVNFNNSMAEIITWITTAGLFGAAAWLLFAAGFLVYALGRTNQESEIKNQESWRGFSSGGGGASSLKAGLLASWVFILATKFAYGTSLPLEFLFWLIPALFVLAQTGADYTRTDADLRGSDVGQSTHYSLLTTHSVWHYRFQVGSVKTLAVFFVLMVVLLGTLLGGYFTVRRWLAEFDFMKAVNAEAKPETRDQVLEGINGAIGTNPYEVRYFRVLTQVLFQKMNDIAAAIQARPAEARQANAEESVLLRNLAVRAISSVQRTRLLDPKNVGVAVDAAESFRGLTAFVQGADDVAIQNYETASNLEPVNPFIRTQLGQLYLLKSGLLIQGYDVDVDWLAKSKAALDKAIDLNSGYANARFFRALITDYEGDKPKAWEEFKALRAANPDNQLVARITQNLEAGLPALGVPPAPAMPPQSPAAGETKGVPPASR